MVKARMRAKAASASQKSSDAAGKGVDAKDAAAEDAEHDKARRAFVVSSLLSPRSFPPSPSSERVNECSFARLVPRADLDADVHVAHPSPRASPSRRSSSHRIASHRIRR
jgi:hypothetical protein